MCRGFVIGVGTMSEFGLDAWLGHRVNAQALSHAWFADAAVFAASALSNVLLVLLVLYGFSRPDRSVQWLIVAVVVAGAAWLAARGIQSLWFRPRPFQADVAQALMAHRGSSSFPSTHASVIFALGWLGLAMRVRWPFLTLWWVVSLCVVAGRVASGLHYPSDVIAGLIVGGLCALLGVAIAKRARLVIHPGHRA